MAALAGLMLAAAPAAAQRLAGEPQWIQLGTKRVGPGAETDVVPVGRQAGFFDKIRLSVNGSDLFVRDIRIVFANGEVQSIVYNGKIQNNDYSYPLQLQGGIRHIDRIEMTYRARLKLSGGGTRVTLWGESIGDRDYNRFDSGWELLGKEVVGPDVKTDTIPVGRQEGRFEAIRLRVFRSDVAFHDIRVVYGNGESDTLAVRKLVRAGEATPPLDLQGGGRRIREIQLVNQSNPNYPGRAIVQVWAKRSADDRGERPYRGRDFERSRDRFDRR
jgi:hypothetical protein